MSAHFEKGHAVSVGIKLKQRGSSGNEDVQAVSNMSLGAPADISLAQGTPAIVASDKLGSDLALSFADGKTLLVQDFFVIGEEGDFSRLLLPDGEAFVTGLMGPEPTYSTDGDVAEHTVHDAEDAAALQAEQPGVQESAGEGMDWSSPLLLAGTGLSLGAGVNFLSGSDDDGAPVAAQSETAELSLAVDEVIGAEPDKLTPEEYDSEVSTTGPETAEAPEGAAMEGADPADDAMEGAFVGGADMPMDMEYQQDLLAELMTEFVG
ncbi:hypothetical protein [Sulfitobacter dubius]|uniref:hypothetical protein n=1 Tax=Sulfitobacter dubius TaxID=218673 RepID=UPI001FAC2789|nr:hypothetical protein [Sulfitobacter dubius]